MIAFISEILDETVTEWLNIYLDNDIESGPAAASLGYSLYTSALLAGRLVGDSVSRHVSPIRILQVGGLVAGGAMLVGIGINTENAILMTTGVVGLGTSLILPTIYRLAGSAPGVRKTRPLLVWT